MQIMSIILSLSRKYVLLEPLTPENFQPTPFMQKSRLILLNFHSTIVVYQSGMKLFVLVFALLAIFASAAECPHDLEVRCIDDINKAYPVCEKAAHEKGADVPADLDCMKYFVRMEKDCWPCICWVASLNKWHIKGC